MSIEPHLLISTKGSSLRFWYPAVGRLKCTVDLRTKWAKFAVFSPDATKIAAPYDTTGTGDRHPNSIIIISAADASQLKTIRHDLPRLSCAAWLPSGDKLLAGGHMEIQVIDLNYGRLVARLWGFEMAVLAIDISADGRFFASVCDSDHSELRVWCARTWTLLWVQKLGDLSRAVSFFADGSRIAVGCDDNNAYVFSVSRGSGQLERGDAMILEHDEMVVDVKVSPDMLTIATCVPDDQNVVYMWDANSGVKLAEFSSPHSCDSRVCYSPDSRLIAGGGDDGSISVWEIDGDQEQPVAVLAGDASFGELNSMAFAPSGGAATGIAVQQNGSDQQSDGRRERKDDTQ